MRPGFRRWKGGRMRAWGEDEERMRRGLASLKVPKAVSQGIS